MSLPVPAPLLTLPTELIVRILSYLECPALLIFRRISRCFRAIIDADTSLQYDIELFAAGALHNTRAASRLALGDRLRLLKERESAWHRLQLSQGIEIHVPHPPSSIYDLTGGIFLLGESYSRRLPTWRPTDATRHIDLRAMLLSSESGDVPDGLWRRINVRSKVMDVGIAAQEHDLIALVTYDFFHTNQFLADIKVHLIQLSTGTSHPAASQPIIDVPRMPFLPGNCSVSVEIVGDTLGVLFNLTRLHHAFGGGTAIRFHLYNWKTGRMLFRKIVENPGPDYNAFCFLSPSVIVLPNVTQNTLELYALPPSSSTPSQPAELELALTLALPLVTPGAVIHRIWCRAEPNAVAGPSAGAPFASDPAQAIILFNVVAQDALQLHYLSLVVHRSALLALLRTHPSPHPTSPPDAPSSAPVLEWPAWGPRTCLWLDGNALAMRWITVTCGQRLVAVRRDAGSAPLQVYDFNARSVRRRQLGEGTRDPEGGSAQTLFVRGTTLTSTIFAEPVVSELVHAYTETPEEYAYESVMMDEGVLIGVALDENTDNIGSLVVHAVGPVV